MHAGTLSLKDIFAPACRYIVPLFQRPYVWNKGDQWEPLWDDVRGLAERVLEGLSTRPHFLGAIVLDQMPQPTGFLVSRLVIDGQQRLTTLQILLEAFYDLCGTHSTERHHRTLEKLTRNDDPMSDDEDVEFKVWPTNVDREHFRRIMRLGSAAEVRKDYGVSSKSATVGPTLGDAYLYFHDDIEEWLGPSTDGFAGRVDALLKVLLESIRLVVIDLGEEDDAQLIFETLNARGTPLQPSDLVKNLLFHRAQDEGSDLEKLYKSHWEPFDAETEYWREKLGRGLNQRPRIDIYLQHYLSMRTRDDVSVAHLYKAFQGHVDNGEPTTASEELTAVSRYAEIYSSFDNKPAGSRERLFFQRLGLMDLGSVYPFLLELFAAHGDQPEAVRTVIEDLESYLVRRMVCRLTTKGYSRMFVDLLGVLPGFASGVANRVRRKLLERDAESTRWPKDAEFREAWLEQAAFRTLVRRRVRMLLEALERQLHTEMTEKLEFGEKLTVEHILPQDWRKHWPLPRGEQRELAELERSRLLHTLGNLTLVTKKLNPSLSNSAWGKKKKALAKHSILKLNAELQPVEVWNEEAIRERGHAMFKLAKAIWPIPEAQKEEKQEAEDANIS